jgi:hypothetical protein
MVFEMVKKFCSFLLLFFLMTTLSSCSSGLKNITQEGSKTSIYLLADQQNAYVLDQSDPKGYDKLYLLNIPTKN